MGSALDIHHFSFTPGQWRSDVGGGNHTTRTIGRVAGRRRLDSVTATSTLDTRCTWRRPATAGATASFNINTASGFETAARQRCLKLLATSTAPATFPARRSADRQRAERRHPELLRQPGRHQRHLQQRHVQPFPAPRPLPSTRPRWDPVTFSSTSTSTTARTIDWTVKDGAANSTWQPARRSTSRQPLHADHDRDHHPDHRRRSRRRRQLSGDTVTGNVTITNTGIGGGHQRCRSRRCSTA